MARITRKGKAKPKRQASKGLVGEAKLDRIATLCAQGLTQTEIGADPEVRLSQGNVSRAIAKIDERNRERYSATRERQIDRILAEIDQIKAECWREYKRSKQDAVKVLTEVSGDKDKVTGKLAEKDARKVTTTEGQCGDPRYLNIIDSQHDKQLKILGAYAPTKIASTTPDGKEALPAFNPYFSLPIDQLLAKAKDLGVDVPVVKDG